MEYLTRAIEIIGSQAELARRINVQPQAVTNWLNGKNMSPESAAAIERETGGKVRADQLVPTVEFVRAKGKITGYHVKIGGDDRKAA